MKRLGLLSITLLSISLSGCQSLLHELQPHRMWRWNYHEAPGRTDGVFMSVDDPLDSAVPSAKHADVAVPNTNP